MKEKNKNHKLGFTLLELLVVVLIVGILAAIALPQYKRAVYKSRYNSLMTLVNAMYQAEESYYLTHDDYTSDFTALDIDLNGCTLSGNKKTCTYDWGTCSISIVADTNTNIGSSVQCFRTQGLYNGYIYYLRLNTGRGTKKRYCFAEGTDKNNTWNKVCKDVGATDFNTPIMFPINNSNLITGNMWRF